MKVNEMSEKENYRSMRDVVRKVKVPNISDGENFVGKMGGFYWVYRVDESEPDDFCQGRHNWSHGMHSGIDLCNDCPAGRTVYHEKGGGGGIIIKRIQTDPPYGY